MCRRIYERETSADGEIPFYKISTFNDEADSFISRELFEAYKKEYRYPNKGDILISAAGTIGRIKEYKGEDAYFQDSNIVWLNIKEKGLLNKYLKYFYETIVWDKLEGGTIKRLYNKDLLGIKIDVPEIEEQDKISDFFYAIDQKIELQEELIENLEEQKKGLMQKIFNQEVRFKDENGEDYREWEEDSIDGFIESNYLRLIQPKELKEFQGSRIYLSTSSIDKYGIVSNEGLITYNNRPSRASMIPLDNSVWFAKMKESIKVYLANKDSENRYVLSTGFYGLKPNCKKINSEYLKQVLLSDDFNNQKDLYSEGTSMSAIKDDHLRFINMNIPNIKEQNKISDLLSLWDNKIDLEKEQLENYKEYKKGLMQRMFI